MTFYLYHGLPCEKSFELFMRICLVQSINRGVLVVEGVPYIAVHVIYHRLVRGSR